MSRAVSVEVSAFYEACHRDRRRRDSLRRGGQGVARRRRVSRPSRRGRAQIRVRRRDHRHRHRAERRARGSAPGSECANGIVVDEFARTADPHIVAAGDCTNHPLPLLGRRVRLESVPNAIHQAKVAAATLLGAPTAYSEVPWFWSDQYDLKLQIAGLSTGYDEVVRARRSRRRGASPRSTSRAGQLLAVDAVNSPREFMAGKKLVANRARIAPDVLRDATVDLCRWRADASCRRRPAYCAATCGPGRFRCSSPVASATSRARVERRDLGSARRRCLRCRAKRARRCRRRRRCRRAPGPTVGQYSAGPFHGWSKYHTGTSVSFKNGQAFESARTNSVPSLGNRDEPVVAESTPLQQQIGVGRRRREAARDRGRLIRAVVRARGRARAVRSIVSSQRPSSPVVLPEQPRVLTDGELENVIGQRVVQHAVGRLRARLADFRSAGCSKATAPAPAAPSNETDDGDE